MSVEIWAYVTVGICVVSMFVVCVMSLNLVSRVTKYVMALRDKQAYVLADKVAHPTRDIDAEERKKLADDYSDMYMRGYATDEDIKRFGVEDNVTQ